jgi:UDP-2-acetamido-3-amino-2,3-dideoxy-glucuronate N-acetyltransferase
VRSSSKYSVIKKSKIGKGSRVYDHVNLYGCTIGKNTKIDAYVYIEEGVTIGDECKIRPFVFIPTGVTIEDGVFIGPNVTFTNDKYPRNNGDWSLLKTRIKRFASIGAGCTINPGVTIGENALIGSGSVVTKDIPSNAVAVGNPAQVVSQRELHR